MLLSRLYMKILVFILKVDFEESKIKFDLISEQGKMATAIIFGFLAYFALFSWKRKTKKRYSLFRIE